MILPERGLQRLKLGSWAARRCVDLQRIGMPQKRVFFAVRVGEFGTGRHRGDARLLLSNPGRFGGHKLGDERLGRAARRRHRHPPVWCVDPEVDVLDALPDELNFNAGNCHRAKITREQGLGGRMVRSVSLFLFHSARFTRNASLDKIYAPTTALYALQLA